MICARMCVSVSCPISRSVKVNTREYTPPTTIVCVAIVLFLFLFPSLPLSPLQTPTQMWLSALRSETWFCENSDYDRDAGYCVSWGSFTSLRTTCRNREQLYFSFPALIIILFIINNSHGRWVIATLIGSCRVCVAFAGLNSQA
jgi:hypothetical protein